MVEYSDYTPITVRGETKPDTPIDRESVEQMADAVWEEYQDSIVNKWNFRKEHVQNAIAKAAAIRAHKD